MSLTKGALEALEQMVADSISADGQLAGIAVHVDPQKNIVDEVIVKLDKIATLIVPLVNTASDDNSGIEGVFYDEVPFSVTVFQNAKLVSGGLSARAIAERIAAILKGNSGWPRNISMRKPTIEHIPDRVLNVYQINAQTSVDGVILDKLPPIIAAGSLGNYILGNAQPGAAIFYTTNGTLPTTSSTLYTGDNLPNGVTVNARAWLAGFLASDYFQLHT